MAANAARIQAEVAEKTLTQVQRPYVFVFGVRALIGDADPYIAYSVANYGRTPAVVGNIGVGFLTQSKRVQPLRVDPPLKADDDHSLAVEAVLSPNEIRGDLKEYLPLGLRGGGIIVNVIDGSIPAVIPKLKDENYCFSA